MIRNHRPKKDRTTLAFLVCSLFTLVFRDEEETSSFLAHYVLPYLIRSVRSSVTLAVNAGADTGVNFRWV